MSKQGFGKVREDFGKVSERFRQVSERFREGCGEVPWMFFRGGFGKVSGRFRGSACVRACVRAKIG